MAQKKLPFKLPPIQSYLFHTFRLGIIWDRVECLPWFYSNYIQLLCQETPSDGQNQFHFDFFPMYYNHVDVPWLYGPHFFDKDTVFNCNIDINQLIIQYIDRDYYLYAVVDEFFIPNRSSYQTRHYYHDNLVYGYDTERKMFNIAGFDDRFLRVSESEVDFMEYHNAFMSKESLSPWRKRVTCFKKSDPYQYDLDLKLISEFLNEYLLSIDSSHRLRMVHNPENNITYGMKVYECLRRYLELVLMDQIGGNIVLPVNIFCEHKACMLLRLKYMEENGYLDNGGLIYERYQNIERNFLIARNLMIKYTGSKNQRDISRVIDIVHKMESEEREALLDLQKKITDLACDNKSEER